MTTFILVLRVVDADEIKRLSRSFRRLDLNQNGALDVDEFLQIPELQQNPLVRRVIEIFDEDGNGEVDFKGEKCRLCVRLFSCAAGKVVVCCSVSPLCKVSATLSHVKVGVGHSVSVDIHFCSCICVYLCMTLCV